MKKVCIRLLKNVQRGGVDYVDVLSMPDIRKVFQVQAESLDRILKIRALLALEKFVQPKEPSKKAGDNIADMMALREARLKMEEIVKTEFPKARITNAAERRDYDDNSKYVRFSIMLDITEEEMAKDDWKAYEFA